VDDLLLKYHKILKDALLHDIGIIRNPKKVLLVLKAAGAFQNLQETQQPKVVVRQYKFGEIPRSVKGPG
jgi:3-methyladenine DNA glycosylase Tag